MTMPTNNLLGDIGQFTGTEHWYRTVIPSITYTDGAKYVADQCQAYWLLDDIAIYQTEEAVQKEKFQVWKLTTNLNDHTAVLSCEDGGKNGEESKVVWETEIDYTTFPVESIVLWYTDRVILLPSEY